MTKLDICETLPNDIEFHLISLGFYESERAPNSRRNAPIKHPEEKNRGAPKVSHGWKPSEKGEEPPY